MRNRPTPKHVQVCPTRVESRGPRRRKLRHHIMEVLIAITTFTFATIVASVIFITLPQH